MKFLSIFAMFILITPILATAEIVNAEIVKGTYSIKDVVCEIKDDKRFEQHRSFTKMHGVTVSLSNDGTLTGTLPSYIFPKYCKYIYSGTYHISGKNIYADLTKIGIERAPDSEYPCPPPGDTEANGDTEIKITYEIVNRVTFKFFFFEAGEICGKEGDRPYEPYLLMTLKQN